MKKGPRREVEGIKEKEGGKGQRGYERGVRVKERWKDTGRRKKK